MNSLGFECAKALHRKEGGTGLQSLEQFAIMRTSVVSFSHEIACLVMIFERGGVLARGTKRSGQCSKWFADCENHFS